MLIRDTAGSQAATLEAADTHTVTFCLSPHYYTKAKLFVAGAANSRLAQINLTPHPFARFETDLAADFQFEKRFQMFDVKRICTSQQTQLMLELSPAHRQLCVNRPLLVRHASSNMNLSQHY